MEGKVHVKSWTNGASQINTLLFASLLTSTSLMPMAIVNEIKKLMRNFLWEVVKGLPKIHLVAWEDVRFPFDLGGLEVKRVREFNIALLCK